MYSNDMTSRKRKSSQITGSNQKKYKSDSFTTCPSFSPSPKILSPHQSPPRSPRARQSIQSQSNSQSPLPLESTSLETESPQFSRLIKQVTQGQQQTLPHTNGPMVDVESIACKVCGSGDDDASLLLCDGCNEGYHMRCLNEPLFELPHGDWYCTHCLKSKDKQPYTNKKESKTGFLTSGTTITTNSSADDQMMSNGINTNGTTNGSNLMSLSMELNSENGANVHTSDFGSPIGIWPRSQKHKKSHNIWPLVQLPSLEPIPSIKFACHHLDLCDIVNPSQTLDYITWSQFQIELKSNIHQPSSSKIGKHGNTNSDSGNSEKNNTRSGNILDNLDQIHPMFRPVVPSVMSSLGLSNDADASSRERMFRDSLHGSNESRQRQRITRESLVPYDTVPIGTRDATTAMTSDRQPQEPTQGMPYVSGRQAPIQTSRDHQVYTRDSRNSQEKQLYTARSTSRDYNHGREFYPSQRDVNSAASVMTHEITTHVIPEIRKRSREPRITRENTEIPTRVSHPRDLQPHELALPEHGQDHPMQNPTLVSSFHYNLPHQSYTNIIPRDRGSGSHENVEVVRERSMSSGSLEIEIPVGSGNTGKIASISPSSSSVRVSSIPAGPQTTVLYMNQENDGSGFNYPTLGTNNSNSSQGMFVVNGIDEKNKKLANSKKGTLIKKQKKSQKKKRGKQESDDEEEDKDEDDE